MRTPINLSVTLLLLCVVGCAPSHRAVSAFEDGDYCEFCRISAESVDTDHASKNNLALCYDNGWCGITKNPEIAVQYYTLAARWGVQKAIQNLEARGIKAPPPDLKIAKEQQDKKAFGNVLAAALVGGLIYAAAKNAPANSPSVRYPTYFPDNNQGCCSWHQGIARDYFNQPRCHYTGMILCNDLQPSPMCVCN